MSSVLLSPDAALSSPSGDSRAVEELATSPGGGQDQALRPAFVAVLALASGLRLIAVWAAWHLHSAAWFFGQGSELALLAESLKHGHGLSSPFGGATGASAFLSPGYPWLVECLFRIFGSSTTGAALGLMGLQTVFGVATVWMVMIAARRLSGARAATLAGAIWATSPILLFLPTLFWETSLSILLAASLFTLAISPSVWPSCWRWAAFGVLCAGALLVNPALVSIVFCCFMYRAVRHRKRWSGPIAGALVALALYAPWPLRNYQQMHALVLFRSNAGYELWQGNRAEANGYFSPALHLNVNRDEFERYAQLGELAYMAEKQRLAVAGIKAHPAAFAWTTAERFGRFWSGTKENPSPFISGYILLTTSLGLYGLWLLARRQRRVWMLAGALIVLFPLPYYVTHADFRFRLVIDPMLTVLTAYAVVELSRGTP